MFLLAHEPYPLTIDMMMNRRCTIFLLPLVVLLLLGCTHKDLDFSDRAAVLISYDWSRSPEASPEMMRAAVFSDNVQPVFFPFSGSQGGTVDLSKGHTYSFIGYNSDTEYIYTSGSTYGTFEFCCQPTELATFSPMFAPRRAGGSEAPRAIGSETLEIVAEPDPLWYAVAPNVAINGSEVINMPMQSAVHYYTFTIKSVQNLSNVQEILATLSGMSISFNPSQGRCTQTNCIIPFKMESTADNELRGTLRSFGYFPKAEYELEDTKSLVIYVQTGDGRRIYYTFDVTQALDEAAVNPGSSDVAIELKELPIPKPLYNGSGFHPSVEGWQEVQVDIDL